MRAFGILSDGAYTHGVLEQMAMRCEASFVLYRIPYQNVSIQTMLTCPIIMHVNRSCVVSKAFSRSPISAEASAFHMAIMELHRRVGLAPDVRLHCFSDSRILVNALLEKSLYKDNTPWYPVNSLKYWLRDLQKSTGFNIYRFSKFSWIPWRLMKLTAIQH